MILNLFLILIIIFFTLSLNSKFLAKLNLIDYPTGIKIHKKPVPLVGGIMLALVGLVIIFNDNTILNQYEIGFIILVCIFGIIDDAQNINANKKFLILILAFLIFIYLNDNLKIKLIYFQTLGVIYFPDNLFLQIFLSTICFVLLINAYNMCDGINGLACIIFIIWSTYLSMTQENIATSLLPFAFLILIFLIFNLKGDYFLGDGGNYFLSTLIGMIIVKETQYSKQQIYAEEIFLLFMLPGIDMLRLFFHRIYNKKNPFIGDNNHLHHILIKKYNNLNVALLIYSALIITPLLIYNLTSINPLVLIITAFLLYFYLIKKVFIKT